MPPKTLLIPVEFPDPEPLPSTFVGGFTSCRVALLGLYETDEVLDPAERQRREIEAKHTLYTLADQFVQQGEVAEVEFVMGPDLAGEPTRVAEERDLDAVLVPNPITTLGRVLIPIRDREFAEPIAEFVGALNQENIIHATLFHAAADDEAAEDGEQLLHDVRDELVEAGFPRVRIDCEVEISDDPAFAISQAARDYDLLIMGETEVSAYERVFGKTYETVAEETHHPIVVVRT